MGESVNVDADVQICIKHNILDFKEAEILPHQHDHPNDNFHDHCYGGSHRHHHHDIDDCQMGAEAALCWPPQTRRL